MIKEKDNEGPRTKALVKEQRGAYLRKLKGSILMLFSIS